MNAKKLHFILGGTRSGKSTHAEKLAAKLAGAGGEVLYVATAEALDEGMRERIDRHRKLRPRHWHTLEAAQGVGAAITQAQQAQTRPVVLVECMTLLACAVLCKLPPDVSSSEFEAALDQETCALLDAYRAGGADWIVVSSETGLGITPATHMGVVYGDGLGRANQQLAAAADQVTFMVAGIAMAVK